MTTTVEHHEHEAHAAAPPPRGLRRLMAPGWLRALWTTTLFAAVGVGLVTASGTLAGWESVVEWPVVITVGFLTIAPIGFLLGIGAFDYWLYYISGRPSAPRTSSSHGAPPAGRTTSGSTPITR